MNTMYFLEIADLICSVARRENAELMKISNKGIMKCPELAFVYLVAKELSLMSHQIFGQSIDWHLEYSDKDKEKNIRRLDLYIELPGDVIISIEFKLGYEVFEWEKDVIKLNKISIANKILLKMYCVLSTIPGRIEKFESSAQGHLKSKKTDSFDTSVDVDGKVKQCFIGIWEVVL